MLKTDDVAYAIGENLLEMRVILANTIELLELSRFNSDEEKALVEKSIFDISHTIETGVLAKILESHPKLQTLDEFANSDLNEEPIGLDVEPAEHLMFPDRITAILIRQVIFNVGSLLVRSCMLYSQQAHISEEEFFRYKLYVGQISGGPMWDILKDLFSNHPDLAIKGYEEFPWSSQQPDHQSGGA